MSSAARRSRQLSLVEWIIRPGRIVRVRPNNWQLVELPREEYLENANDLEERFSPPPWQDVSGLVRFGSFGGNQELKRGRNGKQY